MGAVEALDGPRAGGRRRRVGRTQAPAEPRSGEVGAGRLLDVLPAHLIPGGGPLSSMTMWWVSGRRRAGWVAEAGGGGGQAGPGGAGLVLREGPACSLKRSWSLAEGECREAPGRKGGQVSGSRYITGVLRREPRSTPRCRVSPECPLSCPPPLQTEI